jgi:hypothetical protein
MEAPPLERRLAAILAAEVEGYSRLMQAMTGLPNPTHTIPAEISVRLARASDA